MVHPVYSLLLTIPAGKVTTYQAIGIFLGMHPRTVASILAKNTEIDRYPCFRVIHADRKIGGYNQWIDEKMRRLISDGVIISNGRVEESCILRSINIR